MLNQFALNNYNPLRGLDEARLLSIMDEGERGAYAALQYLYRYVEKRNASARAVKRRLLSALGALDWTIREVDTEDAEKQRMAARQAETLKAAYDRLDNLRAGLKHLAIADLRGYSHLEKVYRGEDSALIERRYNDDVDGDPWDIVELRPVEQWFWVRDGLYGEWQYNQRAVMGTTRGEPIDRRHWIIREIDDPAMEIIARAHVRQEVSDADWDGYLEDYGVPPMFIEGPPNVPADREAEYQDMAERAVSGARGYLPSGAKLQTPSAGGAGGASIFRDRLVYLDEQIVIAGTSGKLTILSESGSGTLAGGAQMEAFQEIAQSIAGEIAETMQRQFDRPIIERVHPGEPVCAFFEFGRVDERDVAGVIDHATKLAVAGWRMDDEQISELSGYQVTTQQPPEQQFTTMRPDQALEPGAVTDEAITMPSDAPAGSPGVQDARAAATPGGHPGEPGGTPAATITAAAARGLRVTPEFLSPAGDVISRLLAEAQRDDLSDEELLAAAQEMMDALPALALQADVSGVALALQSAMSAAVEGALS